MSLGYTSAHVVKGLGRCPEVVIVLSLWEDSCCSTCLFPTWLETLISNENFFLSVLQVRLILRQELVTGGPESWYQPKYLLSWLPR